MNDFNLSSLAREEPGLLSGQYWAELRIFAEVARAKSFNRAAERLGLSQPTIGRKVRRLQDVIGAQLFTSSKQGVRLTQRGEELARALLDFDRSLFSMATDLKARDKDAEGVVRVNISDGMAAFFAAPAIPAFTERYPRIQLHLRGISSFGELSESQTDMMLTMVPTDQANFECRKLGTIHFVPVATEGYLSRYGRPTRATLADHVFLQSHIYQSEAPIWHDWQEVCAIGRVAHYCDNPFAYGMMVKQSLGIGLLGSYTLRERSAVHVDIGLHVRVQMYGVALVERLQARPVRLAFDWLCETFGEASRWFPPDLTISKLPDTLPAMQTMLSDD